MQEDTSGPDVDRRAVFLLIADLRCHVDWRSQEIGEAVLWLEDFGEAEVGYF